MLYNGIFMIVRDRMRGDKMFTPQLVGYLPLLADFALSSHIYFFCKILFSSRNTTGKSQTAQLPLKL